MILQSDAPGPEKVVVRKKKRYSFCYIFFVFVNWRIRFNRRNKSKCTLKKRIPKKQKCIKPTALSPFFPGYKILLKIYNYYNT